MPVVRIEMWPGRTDEQKAKLIREVTDAVVRTTGAPLESVTVVLYEVKKSHWGIGGEQCSGK